MRIVYYNGARMPISPLDGKYSSRVSDVERVFSSKGLMRARVDVEMRYLFALLAEMGIPTTGDVQDTLLKMGESMDDGDFEKILGYEAETKHDVKAVEYYVRDLLEEQGLAELKPYVHFGLTSEDVNNLSYALMLQEGVRVLCDVATKMLRVFMPIASKSSDMVMMGKTHGQDALPTTMGKELVVHMSRIADELHQIHWWKPAGKLTGAVGTLAAHRQTYPDVDWLQFSRVFVKSLDMSPVMATTQVGPLGKNLKLMHMLVRLSLYIEGASKDIWWYISRGYFSQRFDAKSVGSSTMPQKVNPIHFENAEGNALMARHVAQALVEKLSYSRLQRDLSDSTVKRNFGVVFGHLVLSIKSFEKGLESMVAERTVMEKEVGSEYVVLGEALQSQLRAEGREDAYELIKKKTRGGSLGEKEYVDLLETLPLGDDGKQKLEKLTPLTYTGYSKQIVDNELIDINRIVDSIDTDS